MLNRAWTSYPWADASEWVKCSPVWINDTTHKCAEAVSKSHEAPGDAGPLWIGLVEKMRAHVRRQICEHSLGYRVYFPLAHAVCNQYHQQKPQLLLLLFSPSAVFYTEAVGKWCGWMEEERSLSACLCKGPDRTPGAVGYIWYSWAFLSLAQQYAFRVVQK